MHVHNMHTLSISKGLHNDRLSNVFHSHCSIKHGFKPGILVLFFWFFLQCDRMAADCAFELRKHNVAFVSLWPGAVKTEIFQEARTSDSASKFRDKFVSEYFHNCCKVQVRTAGNSGC